MIPDESLYLYNLTLRQPSSPFKSVIGQFSGSKKEQELVLVSNTVLEVYQPKPDTGKLHKLSSQPAFGVIQNVDKLRLPGTQQDVLVITSDSGNIVIAHYNKETHKFEPSVQEPHSKNGFRRITPGEYLAVSPSNSAIMIGALERTKFVYKVEMESSTGKVRLSSPLEAHASGFLTLDLCALDIGFENPQWAAIEVDYNDHRNYKPEETPLLLRYYEFDQGLNHIVQRKSKEALPAHANLLIPLPNHIGGVLIACDSYLIYEKGLGASRSYIALPVRKNSPGTRIVCSYLHVLKKTDFFILLQSSLGDLFKVTFDYDKKTEEVKGFSVTYFDSIPMCNSINILKSGFMFANVANDNKLFYQFEKLGSENDSTIRSIPEMPNLEDAKSFSPQGLDNLALVDIMESLGPVTGAELIRKSEQLDTPPSLAVLSSHSYLKSLTFGVPVSELVSSPLPMVPTSILMTKKVSTSVSDDYLVLSSTLKSQTLVLSIGEVVEDVSDSGFIADQNTIMVQQVGKQSIAQIHSNGIRHVRHVLDPETGEIVDKKTTDWFPPAGINIVHASANQNQVLIGLSNRELCYFEVDPTDDQLAEYQERHEVGADLITAIAISSDASKMKSDYAIIGCADETIQVLSLKPNNVFEMLSLQALSAKCTSLLMIPQDSSDAYIHIGMDSGVYARVQMDLMTGKLRDTRSKYLGAKAVKLSTLKLSGSDRPGIMAISSSPWIGYQNNEGQIKFVPLIGSKITSGSSFYSEDIGVESVVGISGSDLIIFTIGDEENGSNVNDDFFVTSIKLRFQPRKHILDKKSNCVVVLESEADTVSPYIEGKKVDEDYYHAFGLERKDGSWASSLQVVNFESGDVQQTIEFKNNDCFLSLCFVSFNMEEYVVVASSSNLVIPSKASSHSLHVYRVKRSKAKGFQLDFVHKTDVDGPVSAMTAFGDKLVVGIENTLRIFDLGQKQLLRKSYSKIDYLRRPTAINYIGGDIVIVSDSSESISYLKFDPSSNQFISICNDVMRRQVTSFEVLDPTTVIAGDKFGNIFVNRLPQTISSQLENNALLKYNDDVADSPNSRLDKKCEFYIEDIPTSFVKGTFVVGGTESVIYTGLQGTIGILIPVITKSEAELLTSLEIQLRRFFSAEFDDFDKTKHGFNLLGKDQGKFRSTFNPTKNVIDGDFVEKFYELPLVIKMKLASRMKRTHREIEKKLYDIRNRAAF